MACRNSRVRSGLLCLTLALFVAHAWGAETRQWTDNNGQTMLGTFVRVSGNKAVLKRGSRVIQVPLNSLSQIDRDYIESLNTNNDTKIWIVNRRKLRGSFHEYKDGVVSISFGARTRDYPINALSVEDRNHIRGLLEKDGKLAGLASTDPLKFRGSRPRTANVATDVEHQSRT